MLTTSVDPELEQVPKQLSTDTITINLHCGSIGNIMGTNLHSERNDEGFKTDVCVENKHLTKLLA